MAAKIAEFFGQVDNWIAVITVLYTIITLVITGVKNIKIQYRRRSLKKLLGKDDVSIHIPTRDDVDRLKPVVAMEDYNTAEIMRDILEDNRFHTKIKYIPPGGEIELTRDTANLVICGPKNSSTVRNLFDEFSDLRFAEDEELGWYFEDLETNTKLFSPQDSKTEQYAFLGKVKYKSYEFILICGIHAIGSNGVAFFLSNKDKLDELLKIVSGKLFYCIINSSYGERDKQVYDADLTNHVNIIE